LLQFSLGLAGLMAAPIANGFDFDWCSPEHPEECLNGVSTSLTSVDTVRVVAETGGDTHRLFDEGRWAGWVSGSYNDFESDFRWPPMTRICAFWP